ncbi:Uncharacterised protein [Mycobacteroides abscessus subsp. abscessus]|nr:Uncharacterised protein [Mycobacteroides abscessus subsp. abscessus]
MPRLGEPGSTTCSEASTSWSAPSWDSPPISRSTDHSSTRISSSARAPASARSPATRGAANGSSRVGVMASLILILAPPALSTCSLPTHSMSASTSW